MKKWVLPLVIILCMPLLLSCVAPPQTATVTTTQQTTHTVTTTIIPQNTKYQDLYNFASEGLEIWEIVFSSMSSALLISSGQKPGNSADINILVGSLNKANYRLENLFAPSEVIDVKYSLFNQSDLALKHIAFMFLALKAKEQGNTSESKAYSDIAANGLATSGYYDLEKNNKRRLLDIQLQAQQNLK